MVSLLLLIVYLKSLSEILFIIPFFKLIFKEKGFFWRIFKSWTNWWESREIYHIPPVSTHSPHYEHFPPEWNICYNWWICMETHYYYPESIIYIKVPCCVIHSIALDKFIMTCIHLYSVLQSILIALKILCTSPIHTFPLSKTLATTDFFYCLHRFVFPRKLYSWNHRCNLLRFISCI